MIGPDRFDRVTALAAVPEQVAAYVRAASGAAPRLVGGCVAYAGESRLLLVGYPLHNPQDRDAMAAAVDEAMGLPGLNRLAVIGPCRPPQAPPGAASRADWYFSLDLPPPRLSAKLKNALARAGRELTLETGRSFGSDHAELVARISERRDLSAETRRIFQKIPRYLESSAGSRLFSARLPDGRLAAFGIGEYAALETAFYMFAFRDPVAAPPGAADLVLAGLIAEAVRRGQSRMNLGLGVNAGIEFFKRKWGAKPFLPYIEVEWRLRDGRPPPVDGWLARLRGRR